MKRIIHLHGFASSGHSGTVQVMRQQLYSSGEEVLSPDLPVVPIEAMDFLHDYISKMQPDLITTTSMGGLYGEQFHGWKRLLINPAFSMSKLLTFGGMGRREFRNKREDGAKDFKVDRKMIDEFKIVEKSSFQGIDAADKGLVWGFFGNKDTRVNHQKDFIRYYGKEHFILFDGEHFLNDKILSKYILPQIHTLLEV